MILAADKGKGMFPTHVGMNRIIEKAYGTQTDVPHTRGDEPSSLYL